MLAGNHLAKNCSTKIECHHCDAPHHPLLCKLGDGVHGSDETNISKFNNSSSFTGENRSLGLVCRRPNKAVNVSRAPPSRDIVTPSSGSRLNSLVKSEEWNDSVYTIMYHLITHVIQARGDRTRHNTSCPTITLMSL